MNYALTLTSLLFFIHTTHKANQNRMIPQKGGNFFGLFWKIAAMFLPFVFGVFHRIHAPPLGRDFSSSSFFISIIAQLHHHYQHLEGQRSSIKARAQPVRISKRLAKISTSNLPQMRTGFGIGSFTEWQPFTTIEHKFNNNTSSNAYNAKPMTKLQSYQLQKN